MFEQIENLPEHVMGIKVSGKVTADDYRQHLIPIIEEKLTTHKRVDCLCVIEKSFSGTEPAAIWEDFRFGMAKVNRWGRIAAVTDIDWIENSVNIFKIFWPGHLRQFDLDEYDKARDWVCDINRVALEAEIDEQNSVVILKPSQDESLSEYDFDYVTKIVDDYLADHAHVKGILISSRKFPGWQGLGAMMSHLKFIHDHHKKIERIAVVTNSPLGKFADHVTDHFIKAEIKSFDYDQREKAMNWLTEDDSLI